MLSNTPCVHSELADREDDRFCEREAQYEKCRNAALRDSAGVIQMHNDLIKFIAASGVCREIKENLAESIRDEIENHDTSGIYAHCRAHDPSDGSWAADIHDEICGELLTLERVQQQVRAEVLA